MSGSLLLFADLMIRSSLLVLFIASLTVLIRKSGASAAMRHQIWLCAIAALFLLPVLALSMPALPVPVLPEVSATEAVPVLPPGTGPAAAVTAQPEPLLPDVLLAIYLAVTGGMLLWLLSARRELARLWRSATPADAAWIDLLSRCAADLGLRERVELRLATGSIMPMTWGTRLPKIILPAEARQWTTARCRFVLLHELGHVRRRDSLTQAAAAIARTLWWFHPGVWFAASQLRLEQELAADDLALSAGVPPDGYARNLLELACAYSLPAPAMARRSQLEQRLVAIVRPRSRRASGPGFGAFAVSCVLVATWLSATAIPVERVTATPSTGAIAANPANAVSAHGPAEAPERSAISQAMRAAKAAPVRGADPTEGPSGSAFGKALALYVREKAAYDASLATYGRNLTDYEGRLNIYERDLAEYRLRLATYQADLSGQNPPPLPPMRPIQPTPPIPPIPPIPPAPPIPAVPEAA